MDIKQMDCPSCGGTLNVDKDSNHITCDFCGSSLAVDYSDNEVSLKIRKEVEEHIKGVGEQVSASIQKNSEITQHEIRKLQVQQQIASLESQLFRVNDELRYLQRVKTDKRTRQQWQSLMMERQRLTNRIRSLESGIFQSEDVVERRQQKGEINQREKLGKINQRDEKKSGRRAGCLSSIIAFFTIGMVLFFIGAGLDFLIFGTNSLESGEPGVFGLLSSPLIILVCIIAYVYKSNPKSNISLWLDEKIFKKKNKSKNQE